MRRLALLTLLAFAALCGPALSAPQAVSIANFEFAPDEATVNAGEAVTWRFDGPDTNHSATTQPGGQGESFDSDPGRFPDSSDHPEGDTFRHTFTKPGAYSYFCKVHPDMRGIVKVTNADGSTDNANPEISRVRVVGRSLRFRVDEISNLTVTVRRVGQRRALKTISARRRAGNVALRLPRLARATYRATIKAVDISGIENTRTVHKRFEVG